jgi:hypothetical protein
MKTKIAAQQNSFAQIALPISNRMRCAVFIVLLLFPLVQSCLSEDPLRHCTTAARMATYLLCSTPVMVTSADPFVPEDGLFPKSASDVTRKRVSKVRETLTALVPLPLLP